MARVMMAKASPKYTNGLGISLAILIISSSFLTLKSVSSRHVGNLEKMQRVLGSRPPSCIHKCFNCMPCILTPVIPPSRSQMMVPSEEGEKYYPVSWECRCEDRVFHP